MNDFINIYCWLIFLNNILFTLLINFFHSILLCIHHYHLLLPGLAGGLLFFLLYNFPLTFKQPYIALFSFLAACPIVVLALTFGASSTSRFSRARLSGSKKYLMLLPLIVRWSSAIDSLPFTVNFTAFK